MMNLLLAVDGTPMVAWWQWIGFAGVAVLIVFWVIYRKRQK